MVLLYLMISLGFWQLDRAEYRDNLQRQILERKTYPPASLDTLPESEQERRYLPVELHGYYDSEHSFLLDNRIHAGRAGYHLYTPLLLDDGSAILVNRGFIVLGADRNILPDTSVLDQAGDKLSPSRVTITGLLDLVPVQSIRLSDYKHDSDSWPVVLQHVDLQEIMSITGTRFYDMILWLDEGGIGAKKHDMPVLNFNSAKNIGYAFQWFAMSTALVIIYLVVNTRRQ
jgi:cytochrome oxidase assembly protein ShyY1